MVPQQFVGLLNNRYQIVRLLGQGGWGAVYKARDVVSNFTVALKQNLATDPASASQFQTEGASLARLNHPNLPRVYEYFTDARGAQYIAMEFVAGHHLEAIVRQRGAVNEAQARVWVDQILDALMYLHANRIIHRDIKPQNIIITLQARALLVDFGIAKVHVPGRPTATGARGITPGYSPPEQYGGGTDQRSDLYALGATLYFVLTGIVPPESPDLITRNATLIPPRQIVPALAPAIEVVILRAVQVMSAQRFQSAYEMRTALATLVVPPVFTQPLAPRPALSIWPSLLGASVMLCFLFVCGALTFINRDPILLWLAGTTQTPILIAKITPPITATATGTLRLTPSPTATRTFTLTPSLTATETPTLSRTPTATQTPTLTPTRSPTPTNVPCVNPYPAYYTFPSNISPEMQQWILAETGTWLTTSQLCIRRGECAMISWDAKPENMFKTVENPRYTLEERSADYPDVLLFTRAVERRGNLQVCPHDSTRYVLVYESKHEKMLMWRHIIVLP